MRIAVSGTHCSGKSTLVHDFLASHPDYVHEPEPYEWLEAYGEPLSGEPGCDEFYRQLEVSVERLRGYPRGARVIAERSPLDFVAYLLALREVRGDGQAAALLDSATELAARGMECVDLLVVLPLSRADGIVAPESEDLELRQAMNDCLLELVATTEAIELRGPREVRLAALEQAIAAAEPRFGS